MQQWVSANVGFSTVVATERDRSVQEVAGSIASARKSQSNSSSAQPSVSAARRRRLRRYRVGRL
jgi:hypothetical protein